MHGSRAIRAVVCGFYPLSSRLTLCILFAIFNSYSFSEWPTHETVNVSAGAHLLSPQIEAPADDETIGTKSQGARADEMMTVEALAKKARGGGHLAADQEIEGPAMTMVDDNENAENDPQAPQTSAAENAATEAIDTVTTVIETEKGLPEDIAAPVSDLALHDHHSAHNAHYNEAALYHHNPMHSQAN